MMNRRQPRFSKGDRIGGRFFVHQALMGGMGEVYLCRDEQQMLPFALKTFQDSSPALADIFKSEIANWIALEKHPNIVRCFHMEKLENIPFMVLEWVASDESRGTDLRSWLRHGPLDLPLALRFTIDIVRGLMHANEKSPGIVHRDLKPDNVLVNQSRQAKITDFGLATVAQKARLDTYVMEETDLGQSRYVGDIVGTPAYMPPEQWRGIGDIDFRADIYSIGCIFYELLTGQWLFDAGTLSELRAKHLEAPIPALNYGLPSGVKPILHGCLAKRREDRFAQLDLLLTDLTHLYAAHSKEPLAEVTAGVFTAADYGNRGMTFSILGQEERAIQDYDQAIRLDPKLVQAYCNRGLSYGGLGQHERAIQDYDQAILLDPNFAMTYANYGLSHGALGQHERAIQDYDQAIRLDPSFAIAYLDRGISYFDLGQHERAIQDYDQAIRLDPSSATAYYNRGVSYRVLGHYEQAIKDFDQAIHLDSNYAQAYHDRGGCYFVLGHHTRAIQDQDQAIRLDPSHAPAYYNRGNTYSALGQHKQAIQDHDQAIRLDPNFALAYLNRGNCYFAMGEYERAIEDYDQVIRLDPNYRHVLLNLGTSYEALGQYEWAIQHYDRAIRLDPNLAPAYVGRGNQHAALRKHEQAIQDYGQAIRLDPNFAPAYLNRGNRYADLGQHELAIQDYDQAIRLDPNDAKAYFNKGCLLANTGRLQESLSLLGKASVMGFQQAAGAIQQVRQMLNLPPVEIQVDPNDRKAAFESFQRADSLDAMRQVVQRLPTLKKMIPAIEQVIKEQVPPEQHSGFEQKLAWLRQIVKGK